MSALRAKWGNRLPSAEWDKLVTDFAEERPNISARKQFLRSILTGGTGNISKIGVTLVNSNVTNLGDM